MAIQIIGNVGNQGYALPMVSAYPLDVNVAQVLGWNPVAQALDYVPFIVSGPGNIGILGTLAVTGASTFTGAVAMATTLAVAGVASFASPLSVNAGIGAVDTSLELLNNTAVAGTLTASGLVSSTTGNVLSGVAGTGTSISPTGGLTVGANAVVGARKTGWAAMTGTPLKTTFTTAGVTLPQLAGIVMALQADMINHGLIGA